MQGEISCLFKVYMSYRNNVANAKQSGKRQIISTVKNTTQKNIEEVKAMVPSLNTKGHAYDFPIPGYKTKTTLNLRFLVNRSSG